MSRQYNEWYFGGRDDRDHIDKAYDAWRERIEKAQGIHKNIESLYPPFPPAKIDPLTTVANPAQAKQLVRDKWKLAREQKARAKQRKQKART